ncbi:DEAD/DEAH box helicase family protein [Shewanella seohaensis]|uniref:DEAD/DEAH box helicase family protein n=1 Tax=Shewanella seohaensis TaxID=755175 RepID=UPI0021C72842|nr:DEAD/DEAH box helicase family protein [Shewanella seohaensis]UXM81428.1 DEAD/DEAH box helicase family protein [Shewanella seohaensis]
MAAVFRARPQLDGHGLEDVTNKELAKLGCGHFQSQGQPLKSDHWELRVEGKKQAQSLMLESRTNQGLNDTDSLTCSAFPALVWQLESVCVEEKWIQLIEKEGGEDTGKSDLDYFFGDNQNIKILDSTQRKNDDGFRVLKVRQDEHQILLARNIKGKKNWNSEYPSQQGKFCEIRVSVDTSQLKRQKDAINQLMSRPSSGHWPLIQMLQKREQTRWPDVQPVRIVESEWKVLTDPNFDGCDRQREFVTKALANEDFTILDGPPGTGKTTTILELIMQLVRQGKRILLSASTHAAINNVLERIKENPVLSAQIFPLRIGDENNAIGVEEFQFDKLFDDLKKTNGCENLSKQLMVDSSNLVCGTTIGILRLFNDREVSLDTGEPPFDVMIIDECSKTTFQEFLVPARFAKRWVLVGDVRQLSPFTDREQIVANLDNLILVPPKGKTPAQNLPAAVQQACFLLEVLRGDHQSPYSQTMLVPVTRDVASALVAEIRTRTSLPKLAKGLDNLLVVTASAGRDADSHQLGLKQIQQKPERLYRHSLCFVEEGCLGELTGWIPDDMLILHPDWCRMSQAAQHKVWGTGCKPFKVKTSDYADTVQVHKELLDRIDSTKWSEEVCWRLEREYWLRLSANQKQKTGYLEDTLERLFPKSVSADGRIHVLKNIAFPSILEALSGDGLVKRKSDDPTTLNQGFDASEKSQRYTTLTYQHRMHPDISAFPRQQFYPQGVLKDGGKTASDRAWQYARYKSRNIWLDVRGETWGNSNKQETQTLITELEAFCDWAEGKSKNKKGESFDVAVLTFYKGQEKALREALQKLPGNANRYARFNYRGISIKLATVDYFQGQEADVVFLSMVNTHRDGFMDSPNRLNVSITRARYQLVIVGHHEYFSQRSRTLELKKLAESCRASTASSSKQLHHHSGKKGKSH